MSFTRQQIENARMTSGDPDLRVAHQMFQDIKTRVDNGTAISHYETYHFCDYMWVASRKNLPGYDFNSYNICEDYFFDYAFKEYWDDLHGINEHREWLIGRRLLTKDEIQEEVQRLDQISKTWYSIIINTNHPEALINQISKDARDQIKELDKLPEFNEYGFLNKSFAYQHTLKFILLRSKYVYLKTKDLFDGMCVAKWDLFLGPRVIELDTYSMIHIISRHYPIGQKHVRMDKSDHDRSIHPNDIVNTLTKLFSGIPSALVTHLDSNKIYFEYEDRIYVIWIALAKRPAMTGGGHEQFERIGSFYPLDDQVELLRIKGTMSLVDIGNGFQLYTHP